MFCFRVHFTEYTRILLLLYILGTENAIVYIGPLKVAVQEAV
jgi:hypothetical protein